ncbi:hypothetical protein CAPTEDRAFT_217390 [Capitella teleta]|uniref:Uncharacterized protein n=1 Tax=Capitella teleta TaxID=283909 RepID=R7UJE4_CAPTE|nr:hypothetical protein CAPTEDRAFT_217390 [Capitella teleta]|eukprot:ELU06218.1 hypothetical protein CAPTEDRAFT_217390 [Capitella teleta]
MDAQVSAKNICGHLDMERHSDPALAFVEFGNMVERLGVPHAVLAKSGFFALSSNSNCLSFRSGAKTFRRNYGLHVIVFGAPKRKRAGPDMVAPLLMQDLRRWDKGCRQEREDAAAAMETNNDDEEGMDVANDEPHSRVRPSDLIFTRGAFTCDGLNEVLDRETASSTCDAAKIDATRKRNSYIHRHGALKAASVGLLAIEAVKSVNAGLEEIGVLTQLRNPDLTEPYHYTFVHGWYRLVEEEEEEEEEKAETSLGNAPIKKKKLVGCHYRSNMLPDVSCVITPLCCRPGEKRRHYWFYSREPNFGKSHLLQQLSRDYSLYVVASRDNMCGVSNHYQMLGYDETSSLPPTETFKALTGGNGANVAMNRKSYGSSFRPRQDVQVIVCANWSPWEKFATYDRSLRRPIVSRHFAKQIQERFNIVALDGDAHADLVRFLHPRDWTEEDMQAEMRRRFAGRMSAGGAEMDTYLAEALVELWNCVFAPWASSKAAMEVRDALKENGTRVLTPLSFYLHELDAALKVNWVLNEVLPLAQICLQKVRGSVGQTWESLGRCVVASINDDPLNKRDTTTDTKKTLTSQIPAFADFWRRFAPQYYPHAIHALREIWQSKGPFHVQVNKVPVDDKSMTGGDAKIAGHKPLYEVVEKVFSAANIVVATKKERADLYAVKEVLAEDEVPPEWVEVCDVARRVCAKFGMRDPLSLLELGRCTAFVSYALLTHSGLQYVALRRRMRELERLCFPHVEVDGAALVPKKDDDADAASAALIKVGLGAAAVIGDGVVKLEALRDGEQTTDHNNDDGEGSNDDDDDSATKRWIDSHMFRGPFLNI